MMEINIWADGDLNLTYSGDKNQPIRDKIHEHIKTFNNAVSEPHHLARREGAVQPLHIILRDGDGKLLGGLIADTYWNWLDVDDFWLDERVRGQGIGNLMLQAAEEEAVKRGCKYGKLETFSFQARGFYEKSGWKVVGALDDYPPGQSFYWLRKDLIQ